jgi:hypothetical protein
MRHFHRTSVAPADVLATADAFFPALDLRATATAPRARTFTGPLGTMSLAVRMEGGHYTFVEVHTDQIGESRMDKNVKRFFVQLRKQADPRRTIGANY